MAIQTLVELLAEVTVEMRLKTVKAMEMGILMLRRRVFWLPLMSATIGPYPLHTLYCATLISPSKDCEGQSRTSDPSQDPRHLILPPIERVEISTEHIRLVAPSSPAFPLEVVVLNLKYGQQPYAESEMTRVQLPPTIECFVGGAAWSSECRIGVRIWQ